MKNTNITVINFDDVQSYEIKKLIDIAGFKSETNAYGISFIDKNVKDQDKYSDLIFRTLREAVNVFQPYLLNVGYMVVV